MKVKAFIKKIFAPIDLTKGNVYKVILSFALPILFSYFFQQIYSLTDAIIVGQNLTSAEVNGVNDSGSLIYIVLQFAFGCSAGFGVVSADLIGQNDKDGVRKSFLVQIILGVIISIILTVLSLVFIEPLLSLLGLYKESGGLTYESAYKYCFIIFLGLFTQLFYNLICSLLRSIGDSLTPLIFLIASTLINVILDTLLVAVFPLGVEGAALATVLSQGISALACFIYTFIRYPYLRFKKEDFKIPFSFYFKHLKLGIPLALNFSILGIGLIVLQNSVIKFDTSLEGEILKEGPAQLAYGAVNKVQSFLYVPLNALGTAMISFCGQNKGANDEDRILKGVKASFIIMLIYSFLACAIAYLLSIDNFYLKIFYDASSISEKTALLGRYNIYLVFPFFPVLGTLVLLRNILQGVEKALFPFLGGIGELLARSFICLFGPYLFTSTISSSLDPVTNPLPFLTVYFADPFSWITASVILGIGYLICFYLPYKKSKKARLAKEDKNSTSK